MQQDPRGVLLTTEGAQAAALFESALIAFLGQRGDTGARISDALAADPGMVASNCLAGFMHLFAARRDQMPQAGSHLVRARAELRVRGGTRRETALVSALAAWHDDGDMWRAVEILDRGLIDAPLDVLLLRLSHAIRFMLGDAVGMRLTLDAVLPAWAPDVAGYGYVLGCHAFALGETGEFALAERIGQRAVSIEPRDLWAAHAVAHAMGALRRPREGIAWIVWLEPHMASGGSFVRHIHWHRALCHLKLGEPEIALALYDQRIRDEPSLEVRDILNAASLLWRLQTADVEVGTGRWDELADIAEHRIGDHAWAFADLHYVLCLAAAGRDHAVGAMLNSIRARSLLHGDTQAHVHRDVGLTAARAVALAMGGDARDAADLFAAVRPSLHRLGGSNVQRDLLRQMHRRAESIAGTAP